MLREQFHRVIAIDGPAASGKDDLAQSYPGNWDLCTLILAPFIERSPGTSCKRKSIRKKTSISLAPFRRPTSHALQNNESRVVIDDVDPGEHLR